MVIIERDPADTVAGSDPVTWAMAQLEDALRRRGWGQGGGADLTILVAGPDSARAQRALAAAGLALPAAPEALALVRSSDTLLTAGSDVRGVVYAVLDVADRVRCAERLAAALDFHRPVLEQPSNAVRSVARLFSSDVEDRAWWYDRSFWTEYLTELATHRFNRFNLTLGLG